MRNNPLTSHIHITSDNGLNRHWQLRSFISTPKPNLIYYLNGPDILRLNTTTREREIVTTLPFTPRCLIAEGGYVCCGGDLGDFAAVRLEGREGQSTTYSTGVEGDADSRLPLDLDPARRLHSNSRPESSGLRRRELPPISMVAKVGKEIVNCVTLWFPKAGLSNQTYNKPVAILSNNDHSVSIVSLPEADLLEKLDLDDCVNRAIISPNGKVLVAIGDDPYMHIYERHSTLKSPRGTGWVKCQKVQLQGQAQEDSCESKGSFAAAFSPSGRYLAIGTQYGQISVYEARLLILPEQDPLLVSFTTSRPNDKQGAVRAMEFSPEPYDLLAWTEHTSRFAIADLRRYFMSRQVIDTDSRAEGLERVIVTERFDDLAIDPRLRHPRSGSERLLSEAEGIMSEMERRQLRSLTREVLERHQSPLTREETAVLEALQVDRRQRDREALLRQAQSNSSQHTPVSWIDVAMGDETRSNWRERPGIGLNWREDAGVRRLPAALPSALREFVSGRPNDSLRAYIDERNRDRERRGQQPRRRGSVILAATASALERDSRDSSNETPRSELTAGRDRISQMPPRLPAIGTDTLNNPWAEIEALYNIAVDPPVDHTARLRIEVEADHRREYTRRLEQRWGGNDDRGQLRLGLEHDEPSSLLKDTTGCCWSQDGRIL